MILLLIELSILPIILSYIDLDTSFTNHRFAAADINGWQFGYELNNDDAVSVKGLTQDKNIDLERSECLTNDGQCTDPNAIQYVGLGIVGYTGGSVKVFENLPPHCQIYFSAEMAVKGLEISIGKIIVMIDSLPVVIYTINPQNDGLFYEATTIQGIYSHYQPFLLFSFHAGFGSYEKSMGIRNINIKYTPCPAGCLICSITEVQLQCSQWVLNYEGMRLNSQLLSNDGWQITKSKEIFKMLTQDLNTISYSFCLSSGLGPFGQDQDVIKTLFLDPHYEVRFNFYIITLLTQLRLQPVVVVRIDGLEVYQFNFQNPEFLINFCQWESYQRSVRQQQKAIKKVDFTLKNTNRKITFSLRMQTITLPIIIDQFILKDFQVYIKKCYQEPNFNCDECVGPEKKDCIQRAKIVNFQQIAALDLTAGHGWQVILPESGGIQTCNSRNYFGLDQTKVMNSYIQKFFTINDPHTDIEISFIIQKIDKYTSENFQIYLDEVLIDEIQFSTIDYQYSYCGSELDDDGQMLYTKKIAHSRTLSLIQIKSTQTTADGVFGIYNFKLKIKNGKESKDLFDDLSINPNFASNQWNQWMITQFSNDLNQYFCDSSVTLIGKLQPEMQIRRFIQNIVIHTQIRIQFTIYLFTSSFNDKSLSLILNNQTVWDQNIGWYTQKACDDNLDTFVVKEDIILDHDLDYAFLIWSSNVQDLSASWGIADFKLYIS
ncbi:unnamed protein product [Paramecium pentaurelia]|uniref:Uncharacterized protein n=1 Tax=Paramecium pentaurelia TaxID=43138 RepID=A0A8S1X2I6_9CILI|nr:unnamed protein product [Paramecium pentaurelia]